MLFCVDVCEIVITGLDTISEMTKTGEFQLRIEMTDWEGESRVAEYGYFRVANVSQLYRLYVTDYSGNAGMVPFLLNLHYCFA